MGQSPFRKQRYTQELRNATRDDEATPKLLPFNLKEGKKKKKKPEGTKGERGGTVAPVRAGPGKGSHPMEVTAPGMITRQN